MVRCICECHNFYPGEVPPDATWELVISCEHKHIAVAQICTSCRDNLIDKGPFWCVQCRGPVMLIWKQLL